MKLFLSLDDAVLVATREFDIDPQLARNEFEQKCYMSDDQWRIGYVEGLGDCIKIIKQAQKDAIYGEEE